MDTLAEVEPVYETLPGWKQDISQVRRCDDLPRRRSSTSSASRRWSAPDPDGERGTGADRDADSVSWIASGTEWRRRDIGRQPFAAIRRKAPAMVERLPPHRSRPDGNCTRIGQSLPATIPCSPVTVTGCRMTCAAAGSGGIQGWATRSRPDSILTTSQPVDHANCTELKRLRPAQANPLLKHESLVDPAKRQALADASRNGRRGTSATRSGRGRVCSIHAHFSCAATATRDTSSGTCSRDTGAGASGVSRRRTRAPGLVGPPVHGASSHSRRSTRAGTGRDRPRSRSPARPGSEQRGRRGPERPCGFRAMGWRQPSPCLPMRSRAACRQPMAPAREDISLLVE